MIIHGSFSHHDQHSPDRVSNVSILTPLNVPTKHLSRNSQDLKHFAGGKIKKGYQGAIGMIPTKWATTKIINGAMGPLSMAYKWIINWVITLLKRGYPPVN